MGLVTKASSSFPFFLSALFFCRGIEEHGYAGCKERWRGNLKGNGCSGVRVSKVYIKEEEGIAATV